MNWSAEQQRLLSAMGFDLLQRSACVDRDADVLAPALPATRRSAAAPLAHLSAEPGSPIDYPKLMQALRRAAGDRDVASLVGDIERLRREPALKRALWPRLRVLRRNH